MYNSYDFEALLLGHLIRFGKEAAQIVMPQLTHDKFIYDMNGRYDGNPDHKKIYQSMMLLVMGQQREPTIANLVGHLGEDYRQYLITLQDRLSMYYRINTLEPETVMDFAERVDTCGIAYAFHAGAQRDGKIIEDPRAFETLVASITDPDAYLNEKLGEGRDIIRNPNQGYKSIAEAVDPFLEKLERLKRGEESLTLDAGLPIFRQYGQIPIGDLITIHGASGSGKSAFVQFIQIGIALGLLANGIPGVVAFNSMEMNYDSLIMRAASMFSGYNSRNLYRGKDYLQGDNYDNYVKWAEWLKNLPYFVDTSSLLTTNLAQYRAEALAAQHGPIWCIAYDYLELFSEEEKQNSVEQELSKRIRRLLAIGKRLNATTLNISQSTFGKYGNGNTWIAGVDGLRYSTAIRHASDQVWELWNPVAIEDGGYTVEVPEGLDKDHAWIFIQKDRDGSQAQIQLGWESEYTRFYDKTLNEFMATKPVLYDHLAQVQEILAGHSDKVQSVPPEDTDIGDLS